MAEGGTLTGPAIGGFSSGDISLTAPSYAPSRPRGSTVSSRRPKRQVTPSSVGGRANGSAVEAVSSRDDAVDEAQLQSRASEQTANDNDEQQDPEAELLSKATQPVTGIRMR